MLTAHLPRNPGLSTVALGCDGGLPGAVNAGHDGRRGMICHLTVDPAHRGQHLGRRLVAHSLAGLRAAGLAKASILVHAQNNVAFAFWKKLGWITREDLRLMQVALEQTSL